MSEYITNGESALAVRQKINSGLLVPAEATESSSATEITAPTGVSYIYFSAPSDYSGKPLKINGTVFFLMSQYNAEPVVGWVSGSIVKMFLDNNSKIAYVEDVPCYTKQETLTPDTAGLFNNASTPNDAFAFLGNYTQWRWNRRTVVFEEVKGDEETISFGPADKSFTVDYASRITIDQENGNISLQSPTSYSFTVTGSSSNLDAIENKFNSIKGKYIKSSGDVYFLGANFTCTSLSSGGSSVYVYLENAKKISVLKNTGHWEEVRASTNGAYPNSGIHDGYEYVALGMPLENAKNRIPVIGSYTGTGVYGKENKNHISLPGKPLCILIFANKESSRMFISCESDSGTAVFSSATDDYFNNVYSFDNNGNDLYWYCNYGGSAGGGTGSNASAYGQLNSSGVKYNYIAFYGGV